MKYQRSGEDYITKSFLNKYPSNQIKKNDMGGGKAVASKGE